MIGIGVFLWRKRINPVFPLHVERINRAVPDEPQGSVFSYLYRTDVAGHHRTEGLGAVIELLQATVRRHE